MDIAPEAFDTDGGGVLDEVLEHRATDAAALPFVTDRQRELRVAAGDPGPLRVPDRVGPVPRDRDVLLAVDHLAELLDHPRRDMRHAGMEAQEQRSLPEPAEHRADCLVIAVRERLDADLGRQRVHRVLGHRSVPFGSGSGSAATPSGVT